MLRYVGRRLLIVVPSLLLVSMLTFVMVRTAVGDPAELRLGLRATTESLARMRREMGLADPWPVQYVHWLGNAVRGDLGRSYMTGANVKQEILLRLPATIELAVATVLIAIPIAVVVGTIAAHHPHTTLDNLSMVAGLVGISTPTFWLGMMFIIVLAVWLHWLPVAGSVDPHLGIYSITGFSVLDGLLQGGLPAFWDALKHLILPALTLSGWLMGILARHMRSSLLEVLHQDYVRTARAKGLGFLRVVWHHGFPNALIPVVTVVALEAGHLVGGAVITETVFAWPGIGQLIIQAMTARDYMLVQGAVLLFVLVYAVLNIIADVLYACLDPRIRYT